ncbi:MAG TPA: carboxypeptidase-like regulatory domain-containing protein, partial [Blastocatellia bacterium]|nr:carboxypeptidase-like regulatory domain-containing protein [Blastocatellia bacterium]
MSTRIPGNSLRTGADRPGAWRSFTIALAILVTAATQNSASQHPPAQSEGSAILGIVQDDRGAPLANARVTVTSGDFSVSKITEADGRFEFRQLKPAQYRISIEAARFRKESMTVTLRLDETFAAPPVKLSPSSLHVAVLDAGSQPLGGVTVSLYSKERGTVGPLAARNPTDEFGDAYFGRLAPGSYQLSATLRGYDEYRNDVFISPGITTEFPLQLLVAPVIPI